MVDQDTSRKLVVIVHADVVDSTTLVKSNETLAHERIQDTFQRFSDTISSYNGVSHEIRGDALVAEFAKASDAISASTAFQFANAEHNDGLKDDVRPVIRVGIAMGEVVVADNTVTGEGVVLAQRLEQLAEPGGIVIQGAAYETVPKRLPFKYENLGDRELKGFDEPVKAYTVSLRAKGEIPQPETPLKQDPTALVPPKKPAIAVLPFTNMSDDPEQEYFSDGVTEDVITGLSKHPDLYVISRNSTFIYKHKSARARDVGKELGARYVLEGSVRKMGERIRVTAQLTDAVNEHNLWVERYDRDLRDIFAVQDEVVGSILHALGSADGILEKTARQLYPESSTSSITAYDCYLRGREHFYRHGDDGFESAEALYEKAIQLDVEFARAYSALAWLHFVRFKLFRTRSFDSIKDKAFGLALHAAQLDPNDYRAHWVLGLLYIHQGMHTRSLSEFDKAIRINPNDANLLAFSAEVLIYCGQTEEALQRCQHAIRLNPNCPDWFYWILGSAYFHRGCYQEALESLNRMTMPQHAARLLAATYAHLGQLKEARAAAQEYIKLVPDFSIAEWAKTEFYRNPDELERFIKGQRLAGLPE